MLTEHIRNRIIELQNQYPEKRSALIPALHLVQSFIGYLPSNVQAEVADLFDIDANEVHAIVTFYDMFYDKPVGKHIIHVCKNVSCMLRGSDELLTALCHKLQIEPGATTPDGQYTVIASECLAACDRAPMAIVDDTVVGPVSAENIDSILEVAQQSKGHPSPVKMEVDHG